jgi:hypothetical protein
MNIITSMAMSTRASNLQATTYDKRNGDTGQGMDDREGLAVLVTVDVAKRPTNIEQERKKRMNKMTTLLAATVLLGILAAPEAYGQRGLHGRGGGGGWGAGSQYNRLYNTNTVETVSGEVIAVKHIAPTNAISYGVHLELKAEKETVSVHLGPGWFIDNQDITIEPKDKVEIKGSRVTFDGKPVIIAAEIKKGDEVLKLRDQNGVPVWAGWRSTRSTQIERP